MLPGMLFCYVAWWICMTVLGVLILAQQSQAQGSYERCYSLSTETHCFKTARGDNGLQSFDDASDWCAARNYTLVKIYSDEVQSAVREFLQEFELTSDGVWIAAKRTTQGQWTWVNGEVLSNIIFFLLLQYCRSKTRTAIQRATFWSSA